MFHRVLSTTCLLWIVGTIAGFVDWVFIQDVDHNVLDVEPVDHLMGTFAAASFASLHFAILLGSMIGLLPSRWFSSLKAYFTRPEAQDGSTQRLAGQWSALMITSLLVAGIHWFASGLTHQFVTFR